MRIISYLTARFDIQIRKDGEEFSFNCPLCQSRIGREDLKQHFSFNVILQKGNCFRCGWRPHSALSLIADVEHVSISEAYSLLQAYPVMDFHFPKEKKSASPIRLPKEFQALPGKGDEDSNASFVARMAWKYIVGRGLTKTKITSFGIGYCGTGQWARRIIVPFREYGRLVYFVGRSFYNDKPRYKYPSASEAGGVGKADVVAFLNVASKSPDVVICEGCFDAMAVGKNAVALLGKDCSETQLHKILLCEFESATVLLDSDARKEAVALARRLSAYVPTNIALLDKGDPAENRSRLSRCRIEPYSLETELEQEMVR